MKKYPGISKLLGEKAKRRRRLAALTFEEKIAIVEKWRRLTTLINETEFARSNKTRSREKSR